MPLKDKIARMNIRRLFQSHWGKICSVLAVGLLSFIYFSKKTRAGGIRCPLDGPGSAAPLNKHKFLSSIKDAVDHMKTKSIDSVLITTMNNAAAVHNFPIFYKSLEMLKTPELLESILIFCLDRDACNICKDKHHSMLCVHMDLGISNSSLAPAVGHGGHKEEDYWRLTYGRVFATISVFQHKVNVLTVDVDSIWLKSPFASNNGIVNRPNDIAVVHDIRPFTFSYSDKAPINGGFIYFPGASLIIFRPKHTHFNTFLSHITSFMSFIRPKFPSLTFFFVSNHLPPSHRCRSNRCSIQ